MAQVPTVTLRDLAAARWLLGPPGTAIRALVVEAFPAEGLRAAQSAVSTHNMELRMQRWRGAIRLIASDLAAADERERWGLRRCRSCFANPSRLSLPHCAAAASLHRCSSSSIISVP